MQRVYLLGAGFSRAISDLMPLMNELSEAVQERLIGRNIPGAQTPVASNFERWLSYLIERPPWLSPADQEQNRAGFLYVSNAVYSELSERQAQVVASQDDCPDWLQRLVKHWQECSATVMTFNYDNLLELAWRRHAAPTVGTAPGPRPWSDLYAVPLSPIGIRFGSTFGGLPPADGLHLLKLHGSLDWYYSGPDGAAGDTIYAANLGTVNRPEWSPLQLRNEWVEKASFDLEPMIVPPAAVKSPYYNNRTLQACWKRAALALGQAGELVIMGFSLPQTDLLVSSMLATTLPNESRITPIDFGTDVVNRITETLQITTDSQRLDTTFTGRCADAIPAWVEANMG
jgi:hypothetical protein